MDKTDRLNLQKMIRENDVKDCTEDIRAKKHSKMIRGDVNTLLELKKKYTRLIQTNPKQFESMAVSRCSFLFTNYTDIYNKVYKDEIDINILWQFLNVLEKIENNEIDQHTGSFEVGKLLKSIYVDSALRRADKLNKKTKVVKKPKIKNVTCAQFKLMNN